jgi:hypothetical protein
MSAGSYPRCANGAHGLDALAVLHGEAVCTDCRERPRRRRRTYWPGVCEDCRREREVTSVTFPDSPTQRRVCRRCIRPYRASILAP